MYWSDSGPSIRSGQLSLLRTITECKAMSKLWAPPSQNKTNLLDYIFALFGGCPLCFQGLLWYYDQGSILEEPRESYGVLGMESALPTCKAIDLPSALFFLTSIIFYISYCIHSVVFTTEQLLLFILLIRNS